MDIILFMLFMWGLYKLAVFIWGKIISIKNSIVDQVSPKNPELFTDHIIGDIYLN
jgi:hypothetical protein